MVRGSLPALLLTPILAAAGAPVAQQGPSSEAVNAAIERGIGFLLRSQNRDGSFGVDLNERVAWHDLRDGACALAIYALLKCGLPPEHPSLQRARAFLLESDPVHTYAFGIQLHALGALDPLAHKKRMQELLERLVDLREGSGWDYPGLGRPDLSNTQVAALGFRAAHSSGLALPKGLWSDLVEIALRYQEKPVEIPGSGLLPKEKRFMAGFFYEPGATVSAAMTTAGLTILGIAGEDPARVDQRLDGKIAEARALALNWLEQHYSIEGNPGGDPGWHLYYLYGLERVGAFCGLSEIGGHDWYREGAAELIRTQRAEGGWWNEGRLIWPPAPMPIANTCFALLFLRKATLSPAAGRREHFASMEQPDSDVWVRVDAKQVWTAWLSGFSAAALARFAPVETPDGPRPGLCVERVAWWIDGVEVASVPGDPRMPWRDERFALRHEPAHGGELVLECRITTHGADGQPLELRSTPLRVRHELALEPWMLEYAVDAGQNLLLGKGITLTVSSEESAFHPKGDALDGLQGSAWWARADDTAPWIRLESAKGVRIKELWLSPAAANEVAQGVCVRVESVELRLNDAKAPLVIQLDPDPRLKTKFVLPKSTLVKSLELRVVAPPLEPGKSVGWAEIEAR